MSESRSRRDPGGSALDRSDEATRRFSDAALMGTVTVPGDLTLTAARLGFVPCDDQLSASCVNLDVATIGSVRPYPGEAIVEVVVEAGQVYMLRLRDTESWASAIQEAVASATSRRTKACPQCSGALPAAAIKCPACTYLYCPYERFSAASGR